MTARESEVAAYLLTDATLEALTPGGIYAARELVEELGITDANSTPKVWVGGVFRTTVIVRQRQLVPTGAFTNYTTQQADTRQVVVTWAYARDADTLDEVQAHIYRLLQGYRLSLAWPTDWQPGGVAPMQCPELPSGIQQSAAEYVIRAIRRPVVA